METKLESARCMFVWGGALFLVKCVIRDNPQNMINRENKRLKNDWIS